MKTALRGARLLMALVLILTVAVSCFVLKGFALSAVLLGMAGALWAPYLGGIQRSPFSWREFWGSELGAVLTTYFMRSGIPGGPTLINGSATPPTAIQATQCPKMVVQIIWNIGDTQATITHNWGLDKSSPTYFDPEIIAECLNGSGTASGTWLPMLTFDRTNTNVILVNKLAGAAAVGNAGTFLITLRNNAAMLSNAGGGF